MPGQEFKANIYQVKRLTEDKYQNTDYSGVPPPWYAVIY